VRFSLDCSPSSRCFHVWFRAADSKSTWFSTFCFGLMSSSTASPRTFVRHAQWQLLFHVCAVISSRWSDDEDALITNRWLIFKQYASPRHGRLIWDLLGLIPADYIALSYHDPFSHDFPESECVWLRLAAPFLTHPHLKVLVLSVAQREHRVSLADAVPYHPLCQVS
jgi:hypothetical protein